MDNIYIYDIWIIYGLYRICIYIDVYVDYLDMGNIWIIYIYMIYG